MWEELNINWVVFTEAEKEKIMKARKVGDIKHLANVVDTMTPAKEIEIQKITDALTANAEGFESKVRTEMIAHFKKKNVNGPQSPAEEEQWENKLQEEYSTWLSKKQEKERKRLNSLSRKKGDKPVEEPEATIEEPKEAKPLDLEKMKRDELVELAEDNDVPTSGTKDDIKERLNKVLNE